MNLKSKLITYQKNHQVTFLGVGPMSKNCIDEAVNISKKKQIPIFLIASRRQIECEELGGGYVENFSTRKFSNYIKKKSAKNLFICRDHGGPYQGSEDIKKKISLTKAIENAKTSFKNDILNDFKVIHIDSSISSYKNKKLDIKKSIDILFELYEYCHSVAKKYNKDIVFEIGTEEQSGTSANFEQVEFELDLIINFLKKNKLPTPLFNVIQTGTKVIEDRNTGLLDQFIKTKNHISPEILIPKYIEICSKYGVFIKEHNGDYLSSETLKAHRYLDIQAVNVAPEFALVESKSIIEIMYNLNLKKDIDSLLEISFNSKKWSKWLDVDSKKNDFEKSLLSLHYVYSNLEFKNIKNKVNKMMDNKLDSILKIKINHAICRYLENFGFNV